jgi:shikimate kinase
MAGGPATGAAAGPRVLLVGMMGAGKTTVGRALSARTGWPYLDNDELVVRATGRASPAVLVEGVAALRAAESAALDAALASPPPVIAAVAGGVVDDPADRARLRDGGFVVWLRASAATLARRVAAGPDRPWLAGGTDPTGALASLGRGREEHYAEVAGLVVEVDRLTVAEVVDRILAALSPPEPPPPDTAAG